MKKRRLNSVEAQRNRNGIIFVLPWIIGILLFVIIPIFQSISYSFSSVQTNDYGMLTQHFVGLKNYIYAINKDPKFLTHLLSGFTQLLYSLPSILVISMIIGIILSSEFRGRLFFRILYFLPVIIATGSVLEWINACINPTLMDAGVSSVEATGMIDTSEMLSALGLEGNTFVKYFQIAINEIFDLIWASGIQIILFISGMQSIPDSLYEVSKVEGATKWEEFWFVTFPLLSRTTVLVIIFTIVELTTSKTNPVMKYVFTLMGALNYDESSAMLWVYLICSSAFALLIIALFRTLCAKKWE